MSWRGTIKIACPIRWIPNAKHLQTIRQNRALNPTYSLNLSQTQDPTSGQNTFNRATCSFSALGWGVASTMFIQVSTWTKMFRQVGMTCSSCNGWIWRYGRQLRIMGWLPCANEACNPKYSPPCPKQTKTRLRKIPTNPLSHRYISHIKPYRL